MWDVVSFNSFVNTHFFVGHCQFYTVLILKFLFQTVVDLKGIVLPLIFQLIFPGAGIAQWLERRTRD